MSQFSDIETDVTLRGFNCQAAAARASQSGFLTAHAVLFPLCDTALILVTTDLLM